MSNTTTRAPFDFTAVSTCKIHPGIGIARVGNSPDEPFIGPEVPEYRSPQGGYKDAQGRVRRQAARFRIYAYDKDGNNLGELPIRGAEDDANSAAAVKWTVHLANKKGAGFEFDAYEPSTKRRNPGIEDRQALIIDPSERTITGRLVSGEGYQFESGRFRGKPVPLGEVRTDERGRLIVLGGFGKSEAVVPGDPDPDRPIRNYANNDDWYDDVSDGPVTATVTLPGREGELRLEGANGAWVIVAPPKFAPGIQPVVTLYDVVRDTAIRAGRLQDDPTVSYYRDIYPILLRAADTAWVNNRARIGHGYGKVEQYSAKYPPVAKAFRIDATLLSSSALVSPDHIRASRANDASAKEELPHRIFSRLREPLRLEPTAELPDEQVKPADSVDHDPARIAQATFGFMPSLSGDAGRARKGCPKTWMSLLPRQYEKFRKWSEGDFDTGVEETWAPWDEMTADLQVEALQRAALEPCSGGAFLPGIEMTYIARWMRTFCDAFRIDAQANGAGDLTKYMALPWQADFYDCNSSWWPAQRPDDVIPQDVFEEANVAWREGEKVPMVSEALEGRVRWDRGLGGNTLFRRPWRNPPVEVLDDPRQAAIFGRDDMIRYWGELGFVVPLRAKSGELLHVEVARRPYAGMDARLLFHALLNPTEHRGCRPKAREYVERVLAAAREVQRSPTAFAFRDNIRPFRYDENNFEARMQDIYDDSADFAYFTHNGQPEAYNPDKETHNRYFRTLEEVTERIRQLTPFNFLDGAWLRNIHRVGPVDDVNSILFFIAKEELGDGVPSQNHANIYRDLCHSFGFYPPPVASSAFASDSSFLDAAFDSATFQLAISEFTEDYYPEIIGMSLWLEWTVLELHRIAAIVERVGLSPHFYRMHIAIDNAENGHGAGIIRAVKLYLQQVREAGGDRAVQCQWERIWNGYVAFSYTFSILITQLIFVITEEKNAKRNRLQWLQGRLERLVRQKKAFGQYNHTRHTLGQDNINQLFNDPKSFLGKLVEENWIVPGKPDESPFFQLLEFRGGRRHRDRSKDAQKERVEFEGGRMYSVFTQEEIQLWRDWTFELGKGKQKRAAERLTELLATTDAALAESLAVDALGSLEQAASDERIALWLEMAENDAVRERAASTGTEPVFFSNLKAKAIGSRARLWLGWSMIRAVTHIAGQNWIDLGNDRLIDATGQSRTSIHWLAQIRDAANPAEAAREFLVTLKTEFEKQQNRSPAAIITGLNASPLWTQALDLVVPGNDGRQVRDTMHVWMANGFPLPEMPEGRLKPLRLDATLDEEEHHPTGVALGFGTVH